MKRWLGRVDGLCVTAMILYATNRWLVKPHVSSAFLHDHFNDLLLIPAALPWILWVHHRLGWREFKRPPTVREVSLHLVVWSVVCEGIGPHVFHRGTADWGDVFAYTFGALFAWLWWNRSVIGNPALCEV